MALVSHRTGSGVVKLRAPLADDEQAPGLLFFTQKPAQGCEGMIFTSQSGQTSL